MMASVVPTIAGTIVLMIVPFEPKKRVGLLFAYYIMISFWACSGLALSLVTRNVGGQTKKTVVIAVNFVFWATGNSIGPQVFQTKDAPRYFLALAIILGCFVFLLITLGALRTYYIWQNKKRDGKIERGEALADVLYTHALEDITDRVRCFFACSSEEILLMINAGKCKFQIHLLKLKLELLVEATRGLALTILQVARERKRGSGGVVVPYFIPSINNLKFK
jgi:predicted permease